MKKLFLPLLFILGIGISKNFSQSIRKNYREFTAQEVTDYNNALQTLFQQGVISNLANHHSEHFLTDIHTNIPSPGNGSQFLTWHRLYLLDFEYMLRGTGTNNNYLAVPYWDWTTDNVASNSLFWDNYFLLRSNFSSWGVTRVNSGTLPTQTDISTTLGLTTFFGLNDDVTTAPDFSHRLESWHNRGHGWVGGTMSGGTSPLDPVFYLHHTNVDRLWQQWEETSTGIQANLGTFNTVGLVHWTNILNNQMFDPRSTPRPPSAGSTGRNFDVWYARNGTVILDGANGSNFSANDVTTSYIYRYTAATTHGGSTVTGKMYVGDVQYDASNNVIADTKGGFSIENGVTCHFRAGESIFLKPGFTAKPGCSMTAKIITAANQLRPIPGNDEDLKYDIHPILIDYSDCGKKSLVNSRIKLSVYPNPVVSSYLMFSYNAEKNINKIEASVTDILGRVYSKQFINIVGGINNKTISVSRLPSGTYILSLVTADGKTEKIKFVKE
jgi:tyrosinase